MTVPAKLWSLLPLGESKMRLPQQLKAIGASKQPPTHPFAERIKNKYLLPGYYPFGSVFLIWRHGNHAVNQAIPAPMAINLRLILEQKGATRQLITGKLFDRSLMMAGQSGLKVLPAALEKILTEQVNRQPLPSSQDNKIIADPAIHAYYQRLRRPEPVAHDFNQEVGIPGSTSMHRNRALLNTLKKNRRPNQARTLKPMQLKLRQRAYNSIPGRQNPDTSQPLFSLPRQVTGESNQQPLKPRRETGFRKQSIIMHKPVRMKDTDNQRRQSGQKPAIFLTPQPQESSSNIAFLKGSSGERKVIPAISAPAGFNPTSSREIYPPVGQGTAQIPYPNNKDINNWNLNKQMPAAPTLINFGMTSTKLLRPTSLMNNPALNILTESMTLPYQAENRYYNHYTYRQDQSSKWKDLVSKQLRPERSSSTARSSISTKSESDRFIPTEGLSRTALSNPSGTQSLRKGNTNQAVWQWLGYPVAWSSNLQPKNQPGTAKSHPNQLISQHLLYFLNRRIDPINDISAFTDLHSNKTDWSNIPERLIGYRSSQSTKRKSQRLNVSPFPQHQFIPGVESLLHKVLPLTAGGKRNGSILSWPKGALAEANSNHRPDNVTSSTLMTSAGPITRWSNWTDRLQLGSASPMITQFNPANGNLAAGSYTPALSNTSLALRHILKPGYPVNRPGRRLDFEGIGNQTFSRKSRKKSEKQASTHEARPFIKLLRKLGLRRAFRRQRMPEVSYLSTFRNVILSDTVKRRFPTALFHQAQDVDIKLQLPSWSDQVGTNSIGTNLISAKAPMAFTQDGQQHLQKTVNHSHLQALSYPTSYQLAKPYRNRIVNPIIPAYREADLIRSLRKYQMAKSFPQWSDLRNIASTNLVARIRENPKYKPAYSIKPESGSPANPFSSRPTFARFNQSSPSVGNDAPGWNHDSLFRPRDMSKADFVRDSFPGLTSLGKISLRRAFRRQQMSAFSYLSTFRKVNLSDTARNANWHSIDASPEPMHEVTRLHKRGSVSPWRPEWSRYHSEYSRQSNNPNFKSNTPKSIHYSDLNQRRQDKERSGFFHSITKTRPFKTTAAPGNPVDLSSAADKLAIQPAGNPFVPRKGFKLKQVTDWFNTPMNMKLFQTTTNVPNQFDQNAAVDHAKAQTKRTNLVPRKESNPQEAPDWFSPSRQNQLNKTTAAMNKQLNLNLAIRKLALPTAVRNTLVQGFPKETAAGVINATAHVLPFKTFAQAKAAGQKTGPNMRHPLHKSGPAVGQPEKRSGSTLTTPAGTAFSLPSTRGLLAQLQRGVFTANLAGPAYYPTPARTNLASDRWRNRIIYRNQLMARPDGNSQPGNNSASPVRSLQTRHRVTPGLYTGHDQELAPSSFDQHLIKQKAIKTLVEKQPQAYTKLGQGVDFKYRRETSTAAVANANQPNQMEGKSTSLNNDIRMQIAETRNADLNASEIKKIADRVYRDVQQRMKSERQRRGL